MGILVTDFHLVRLLDLQTQLQKLKRLLFNLWSKSLSGTIEYLMVIYIYNLKYSIVYTTEILIIILNGSDLPKLPNGQ